MRVGLRGCHCCGIMGRAGDVTLKPVTIQSPNPPFFPCL